MPGLDPAIHQKKALFKRMDCRVAPGNDGGQVSADVTCRTWGEGDLAIALAMQCRFAGVSPAWG
jgi:hypothetical protein